jgi:hypothetical protein
LSGRILRCLGTTQPRAGLFAPDATTYQTVELQRKLATLGFTDGQIRKLSEISLPETTEALVVFAEYYFKSYPTGHEKFIKLMADLGGWPPLDCISLEKLARFHNNIMVENHFSEIEAWDLIHKMEGHTKTNLTSFICLALGKEVNIETAIDIFDVPYIDRFPGIKWDAFIFAVAGVSVQNGVELATILEDYDPRRGEGELSYKDTEVRSPYHSSFPLWDRPLPEWFHKTPAHEFVGELKALGIEPAEVLGLLLNSNIEDIPTSKEEFMQLLAGLHQNNGIKRFARYSMRILNAVRNPPKTGINTVIIYPESDHNNSFYRYSDILEQLAGPAHSISLYEVEMDTEIPRRLAKASKERPIDLLVLAAHSNMIGMQINSGFFASITMASTFAIDDLIFPALAQIGGFNEIRFSKDAQAVLVGCSTAWGGAISFANIFAMVFGLEVFANTRNGHLRDWAVQGNGRIGSCEFIDSKGLPSGTVKDKRSH